MNNTPLLNPAPHAQRARFIVGLTGGIGSGKTAVSDGLAQLGADIVDTDRIAHALTAPGGAAIPAIRAAFGPEALRADGSMDRDVIRQRVFSDPSALQQLESILHPLIRQTAQAELAAGNGPYAVLVVPLLIEKQGWRDLLSATVVVDCPEAVQIQRVQARSGLSTAQIEAIMARQATRRQRREAATHLIDNAGDRTQLEQQTRALHAQFLAAAQSTICTGSDK